MAKRKSGENGVPARRRTRKAKPAAPRTLSPVFQMRMPIDFRAVIEAAAAEAKEELPIDPHTGKANMAEWIRRAIWRRLGYSETEARRRAKFSEGRPWPAKEDEAAEA